MPISNITYQLQGLFGYAIPKDSAQVVAKAENNKKHMKKTLVLGASDNTYRYSYIAILRLRGAGHDVIGIGKRHGFASDVEIETKQVPIEDLDTITLYLNPYHQRTYYDYILSLKPRRIIFNPGTENDELYQLALEHDILPVEACTLVLLSTGQY